MRILIVDDEPLIVETIQDLISEDFDCQIKNASNGKQGLEIVRLEKFDLILTDHRMPQMTGGEMIQAIRSEDGLNKETPIIAISAFCDEVGPYIAGLKNITFHSKPISFEIIAKFISELMD